MFDMIRDAMNDYEAFDMDFELTEEDMKWFEENEKEME